MRAWSWSSAVVVVLALATAGCGQPSADLFVVERSGADPAARLTLVVSDGGLVTCNGGEPKAVNADRLLTAREITRRLEEPTALGLELDPGRDPVLSYRVRSQGGTVSFTDSSPQRPRVFDEVAAFTDDIAEDVCGIQR